MDHSRFHYNMAEELLLAPEITMHEEPGEIRIVDVRGGVSMEIDDDEPDYDIPPEISITRVTKPVHRQPQQQHSFLQVRNDLRTMRPAVRPPPLLRIGAPRPGLPSMPRLRFGGPLLPPRMPQHHNQLVGMYNMMPPNSMMGPPGGFPVPHHLPPRPHPQQQHYHHHHHGQDQQQHGGRQQHQMNNSGMIPAAGSSLLRQQRLPHHRRKNNPMMPQNYQPGNFPPHLMLPQEPFPPVPMPSAIIPTAINKPPLNGGHQRQHQHPQSVLAVPSPMRTNKTNRAATAVSTKFPDLNITVTSIPKQQPRRQEPVKEVLEDEEEIDDDEEEEEEEDLKELDDVEPDVNAEQQKLIPRQSIEKLQFVRREDGNGFMRKAAASSSHILSKKKGGRKKIRRFFKGANYRFDGSIIKKRPGKIASSVTRDTGSRLASEFTTTVEDVPVQVKPKVEGDFLSYLGIQRKDDNTDAAVITALERQPTPKAKKSFRPSSVSPPALISSRPISDDGSMAGSNDVLTIIKKRKVHNSDKDFMSSKKAKSEDGSVIINLQRPLLPLANDADEKPLARKLPKEAKNISECPKLQPCICDCTKILDDSITKHIKSSAKPADTKECQAIESVGGSQVGCHNKIQNLGQFHRASENLEPAQLCEAHISRLKTHQCCGFCGEFCAHGMFLMCRPFTKAEPHLFHKSCYYGNSGTKNDQNWGKKCPHCHSTDKPLTVSLKLSMSRMPLSLLIGVPKVSFIKAKKTQMSDLILRRTNVMTYEMPNSGKLISSEGLPEGLTDDSLEKVIEAVEDKDKLKHTTRNMYLPTKSGDTVKILQLLSLGYSPIAKFTEAENGTPLHVAAAEGHVLMAHVLVQAGAELDAIDDEQNTPLMLASIKGKSNIVRYLLSAGADLTLRGDDGMTCLHLATQSGHLECVHVILGHNSLPRKFINLQDEGGWTPLVWACENKHEDVIHYLLEHGADPLISDAEGNIALHWAALSGSKKTCELLLNHGCDVNATNSIGETPMHIVVRQDHYECTVLFLMLQARLDIKNQNGKIAVECMVIKNPKCATIVKLTSMMYEFMKDTPKNRLEKIIISDLTHGKEANPIQCVNNLDKALEPQDYVYVKQNCFTTTIPIDRNIANLQHCKCNDNCTTEDTCNCSDLSIMSWYDLQGRVKEGFNFREPPMIFECNDLCRCNVSHCHNRVIQHGLSLRLQVFRSIGMGWGVRPLADIPKGTFVCEYVGEIISDLEAETRDDTYLFDLDNKDGDTFCIDANNFGNIARFINHSCSPNLTPVKVFTSHQDIRFPHIALFANRDIEKGEELGFDYGENFWAIKHKSFTCHCASDKCRYSRMNIANFLREYYKRNGKPLAFELQQQQQQSASTATDKIDEPIETALMESQQNEENFEVKTQEPEETIVAEEVSTVSEVVVKTEDKLKLVTKVIIPSTKVDFSKPIINNAKAPDNINTQSSVATRPRRSVTRKTEEISNAK